jgi:Na+/H+ antiporter NhaD/arsenite permease-like protein
MHWDWEAANQFVLVVIGLFGVVLYFGLLYAGVLEFISRISKTKVNKKHSQNRHIARRLRAPKVSGD